MQEEKRSLKYFFSTEGDTERWYLENLANLINDSSDAACKVSFIIKCATPKSFIKRTPILTKTKVFHLFDVESTEPEYENRFTATLDNMRKAEELGKSVEYCPAYSNLTFELWMILHKMDCKSPLFDRKNYLAYINRAFNKDYQSLKEFKEEKHFKGILRQIGIEDVKNAVHRADVIMQENARRGYKPKKHQNFSWYAENPATEVGRVIGGILLACGL